MCFQQQIPATSVHRVATHGMDTLSLVVWWCYGILLKLFIHVIRWVYVLCEKFARFTFYGGRGIPRSLTNQNAAKWFTLVHSQPQIRHKGWSWFIPQNVAHMIAAIIRVVFTS